MLYLEKYVVSYSANVIADLSFKFRSPYWKPNIEYEFL